MASFCYKLVEPLNCWGNTLLGMSTMFPEMFNGQEKTHFPCQWHHIIDWDPGTEEGERELRVSMPRSTSWLQMQYDQLPPVPATMFGWTVPSNHEPKTASFPSVAFTRYFVIEMRKVTNTIIVIKWFESLSSLRNSTTATLEK